jgi:hypothetical protein
VFRYEGEVFPNNVRNASIWRFYHRQPPGFCSEQLHYPSRTNPHQRVCSSVKQILGTNVPWDSYARTAPLPGAEGPLKLVPFSFMVLKFVRDKVYGNEFCTNLLFFVSSQFARPEGTEVRGLLPLLAGRRLTARRQESEREQGEGKAQAQAEISGTGIGIGAARGVRGRGRRSRFAVSWARCGGGGCGWVRLESEGAASLSGCAVSSAEVGELEVEYKN